jgi:hypothetical protein
MTKQNTTHEKIHGVRKVTRTLGKTFTLTNQTLQLVPPPHIQPSRLPPACQLRLKLLKAQGAQVLQQQQQPHHPATRSVYATQPCFAFNDIMTGLWATLATWVSAAAHIRWRLVL